MHPIHKKTCTRTLTAALLTLIVSLAACEEPAAEPPAVVDTAAPIEAESTCGNRGQLSGTIAGAINVQLDWSDDDLRCESMPRPDSQGVRLRFSGEVGDERLAVIVAMPALEAGATGEEFDSNVTITVEGSGRFFSTPNLDTCWTEVATNEALDDETDVFIVVGSLSCVAPLGEINGDAFVDIRDLRFSGIADWNGQ